VLVDEAPTGQVPDAALGNLRVVAPVEIAQVTHLIEAGLVDATLHALRVAAGQFVVDQEREELQRVQPACPRLLDAGLDGVAHAREFELAQARL